MCITFIFNITILYHIALKKYYVHDFSLDSKKIVKNVLYVQKMISQYQKKASIK